MSGLREQYLKAMGLAAWRLRDAADPHAPETERSDTPPAGEREAPEPEAAKSPFSRGMLKSGSAEVRSSHQAPEPGSDEAPFSREAPEPGTAEDAPPAGEGGAVWQRLAEEVRQCTRCALHRGRTQAVFGVGRQDADLLVIGEAPGAEEDRRGEPFVGRAGQLLNAMLRAIGLGREDVYIANILKCRPPGNRDPRPEEAASCTPYLERQIALIQPRAILSVGRVSAQWLLQSDAPIGRLRGQVLRYGEPAIPLVVTYHPAYLLRTPLAKPKAWEDLCKVKRLLSPEQ